MSVTTDEDIPELLLKLCEHLANNKPKNTDKFYKLSYRYIQASCVVPSTRLNDESFILSQIRETLGDQSADDLEKFNLIYSNICKSNVLTKRCSVLTFMFHIANNEKSCLSFLPDFQKSQTNLTSTMSSRMRIESPRNGSQENSVKQIYFAGNYKENTSNSQALSTSQVSMVSSGSQATTVSSSVWSKSASTTTLCNFDTVSEVDLLQDVIYSLQGIEGKYVRKEAGGLGYILDQKVSKGVSIVNRSLVERLVGTSFLHNQIKQYCTFNDKRNGLMCQVLIGAFSDELADYYKTVALLQTSLNKHGCVEHSEMSLRRALYLLYDNHTKFEWLAYIAEACENQKGGALITAIHGFLQHGSEFVQQIAYNMLKGVCRPLYIMLSRWLLDGEINDPNNEFFIESRSGISPERLWYDKYHVKDAMVPSFITSEQADKILATGKSINFLRQICKDEGLMPGRESLFKFFKNMSAEVLFEPEQSIEFHETLEHVYRETSLRVLHLLKNKYMLTQHLQSLRRYMLLGQGDFIHHLMELLEPELNKDANEIYGHTVSTILESAIRVTNAQFEDPETLKRLNYKFLSSSQNEIGWSVFTLVYIVDGPVGTIFMPTMQTYESLFSVLWRAKRMKYILDNMRKEQITISKLFKKIKEMDPVMHLLHIITSHMIHFIHQTQHYFLFEVLECSWAEMLIEVEKATCLDDIIKSHSKFLSAVHSGVLLDESSREIYQLLFSIYTFVQNLEKHQESLHVAAAKEKAAYLAYRARVDSGDSFGVDLKVEAEANERKLQFLKFVSLVRMHVKHLKETYDPFVQKYLNHLAASSKMELQLLSVRLNFNGFYQVM